LWVKDQRESVEKILEMLNMWMQDLKRIKDLRKSENLNMSIESIREEENFDEFSKIYLIIQLIKYKNNHLFI
jgi:hypothetical protein